MAPVASGLLLEAPAITEYVMRAGFKKSHLPIWKMVLLGVVAGAYVSLGAQSLCATLYGAGSTGPAKVLGGAMFSLALMLIIICGAELFTGNVMILVAVLSKRIFLWEMLRDWVVVYFGNFLGCILFASIILGSGVNGRTDHPTAVGDILCHLAEAKANLDLDQAFFRGILANILVCLAVLLAYSAKTPSGKVLGTMFPITAFVVMGYEHSIANQFLFSMATMLNCSGFSVRHAFGELFVATAGNIVGGVLLGATYWVTYIHGTQLELPAVPCDCCPDGDCKNSNNSKTANTADRGRTDHGWFTMSRERCDVCGQLSHGNGECRREPADGSLA